MILEEEREQKNFISFVEDYCDLNPTYEQKGIRKLHHDFNTQKYNRQTSSHEDYFSMTFYDHINGLVSTSVYNCRRNKQDKI